MDHMLADPSNGLNHCQSLCTGSCKYVSYATASELPIFGRCWGRQTCSFNECSHTSASKWVTYEKKRGKLRKYLQYEISKLLNKCKIKITNCFTFIIFSLKEEFQKEKFQTNRHKRNKKIFF